VQLEDMLVVTPRRVDLLNPLGLGILGAGGIIAALTRALPSLETWSDRVGPVLLVAALAYAASVAICCWPTPVAAEVRQIRRLRAAVAEQLALQRPSGSQRNAPLVAMLDDALRCIDDQIEPAVILLATRNHMLRHMLARFDRGELMAPDDASLERLRVVLATQGEALDSAARQVANAYAALLSMAQQGYASGQVAADAECWSSQLLHTEAALAQLMSENSDRDPSSGTPLTP
jgi:hypothetical protein